MYGKEAHDSRLVRQCVWGSCAMGVVYLMQSVVWALYLKNDDSRAFGGDPIFLSLMLLVGVSLTLVSFTRAIQGEILRCKIENALQGEGASAKDESLAEY